MNHPTKDNFQEILDTRKFFSLKITDILRCFKKNWAQVTQQGREEDSCRYIILISKLTLIL